MKRASFLHEEHLHLHSLLKKGKYFDFQRKRNKVDTLSYKTKSFRKEDVNRKWYVIDAEGVVLGRLGTRVATILRGKHRPEYTPHVDCGDNVIIINADKVRLTGNKWNDKVYLRYSGYPGGQKSTTASELRDKKPEKVIENAVKGMLPKNKLGRAMFKKLYVFAGSEHPHGAQKPELIKA